jgi:hypothetical protein
MRLGTLADLSAQTRASESANCDFSPPASTEADIGVDSRSVRQQSHIRLSPESYRLALKALSED